MKFFRFLLTLLTALLVVACGGGSGAGTSVFDGGTSGSGENTGSTGASSATLNLVLSSSTIKAGSPAVVIATLRDAQGNALVGQVLQFSTDSEKGQFSAVSALTNSLGQATVNLLPKIGLTSGADTAIVNATVNGELLSTRRGFEIGAPPASGITLSLSSATVTQALASTVTATVIDASGAPVPGRVVTFTTGDRIGSLSAVTALTNSSGVASVVLAAGAEAVLGASYINASVEVGAESLSASQGFQIAAQSSLVTLGMVLSSSTIKAGSPAVVIATLRDAQGEPLVGQVLRFSTDGAKGQFNQTTVLTDSLGQATVSLLPTIGMTSGADAVVVTATVNGAALATRRGFEIGSPSSSGINLALSSATVTQVSDATVTATVLDSNGAPASGRVVTFTTGTGIGTLSAATALTNASGVASVNLSASSGVALGADYVTASVELASDSLTTSRGFQVATTGVTSTSIAVGVSSSTVTPTSPVVVTATVRNGSGQPVAGTVVRFATVDGAGTLSASTGLTNGQGVATTTLTPSSGASNGSADYVTAAVDLNGQRYQAREAFQVAGAVAKALQLVVALSNTTITAAAPSTVTATLTDGNGSPVAGQVVSFTAGLGALSASSALTDSLGRAQVLLAPKAGEISGANYVEAKTLFNGLSATTQQGFQIGGATVGIAGLTSDLTGNLAAYGQTNLRVTLANTTQGVPVTLVIDSTCIRKGKATAVPATQTITTGIASFSYNDQGCGATDIRDDLSVTIVGSTASRTLELGLSAPSAGSIAFVSATPEVIYLQGSGLGQNSIVTFEVRDQAGRILPGQAVDLALTTLTGGVTLDDGIVVVRKTSDVNGQVRAFVKSGTVPTPVRVRASLVARDISTVSSNLSIAVGLPSQLNFSFSQGSINIEGANIDGTSNTYSVLAADRMGNPVPAGTSINFVAQGGQVEAVKQVQQVNGISRATANFAAAEPRPADGRVTVMAYVLGEESFLDLNGNNVFDSGEPFQDLGDIYLDRDFNGVFDAAVDQFLSLGLSAGSACVAPASALLAIDASIPSRPSTCDGVWGRTYVRRTLETVFSTSSARPLFDSPAGLASTCTRRDLATSSGGTTSTFYQVGGSTLTGLTGDGVFSILVADANTIRLNPMAAGTTVSVSTVSTGLTVQMVGGATVPSTSSVSRAAIAYKFEPGTTAGVANISMRSPSGLTTTVSMTLQQAVATTPCQ